MTLKDFMELRELISIAHHVPGRIRLKIDPRILLHPAASALSGLAAGKPEAGLLGARLNPLARSLTLEYDSSRISPQELDIFLGGGDAEESMNLARKVAALLGIDLQQEP